jgi:hypothetical protein
MSVSPKHIHISLFGAEHDGPRWNHENQRSSAFISGQYLGVGAAKNPAGIIGR